MGCCLACLQSLAQQKPGRLDLSAGYGLAGSFFVRSYSEIPDLPGDLKFFKKQFPGTMQELELGFNLPKNYSIRAGFSRQQFSRKIKYTGMLSDWEINLDRRIYHVDHFYFLGLQKAFKHNQHQWAPLLGVYYIRSFQNEILIRFAFRTYVDEERNFANNKLEEAGVMGGLSYELRFQPKVALGLRSRFYFTVSTGEPESISLVPYVKFIL